MTLYHGTCIEWLGFGIFITGDSGSGKSDLAFRLIDAGAVLIADDQTNIEQKNDTLVASCPENIQGLIEVRGLGILQTPFKQSTVLNLKINLLPLKNIDRLPVKKTENIKGIETPVLDLYPFETSSILKIKSYLSMLNGDINIFL